MQNANAARLNEYLSEYAAAMEAAKKARAAAVAIMEAEGETIYRAPAATISHRAESHPEKFNWKAFRDSAPATFAKYCERHVYEGTNTATWQIKTA